MYIYLSRGDARGIGISWLSGEREKSDEHLSCRPALNRFGSPTEDERFSALGVCGSKSERKNEDVEGRREEDTAVWMPCLLGSVAGLVNVTYVWCSSLAGESGFCSVYESVKDRQDIYNSNRLKPRSCYERNP